MGFLNGSQRPNLPEILGGLKDFQRKTVDYVFHRLYEDKDSVSRFLIADEVGLGKTLVARGVIAKAIDRLWDTTERIDIVYICSNQDIARQNIDRLNITSDRQFQFASRATLLPISLQQLRNNKLNFVSLTPGTSFDLGSRTGVVWERALLYYLLRMHWRRAGDKILGNVLRGDAKKSNWQYYLRSFGNNEEIDGQLQEKFFQALDASPKIKTEFDNLAHEIGSRRTQLSWETRQKRNLWISDLRKLLAHSSLSALEPDIIILDEFQRFRYLLDPESELSPLAQELFTYADAHATDGAKTILLSATPYKMYTLQEEDEDHYKDFLETASFLLENNSEKIDLLEKALRAYREGLYRYALEGDQEIFHAKKQIEAILKKVMVRTERLAVSKDRNGMLRDDSKDLKLEITTTDLQSFAHFDKIANLLDAGDQVEFWKSAAYPINLMDEYKFKRKLEKALESNEMPQLPQMLMQAKKYLLDWEEIQAYKEIDPGNARLRALHKITLDSENWKLLWLPPALPYYQPGANFSGILHSGYTKTLIFSSWKLVPKVIAILTSYEAERRMIAFGTEHDIPYDELTRRRRPLLVFAHSNDRLTGMPVFCITYPCVTLATEVDPLSIAKSIANGDLPTVDKILEIAKEKIASLLSQVTTGVQQHETGPVDGRWYWAALALLDQRFHPNIVETWLKENIGDHVWSQMLEKVEDDSGESRYAEHVELFTKMFNAPEQLGRMPEDLVDVLAQIALASPAVTSLRSLLRLTAVEGNEWTALLAAAARIGLGFRTMFNTPDAISMLNGQYLDIPFWQKTLRYGLDGNLQAVLDEYIHVLQESLGLVGHNSAERTTKIAKTITIALSLRPAPLRFDDYVFDKKGKNEPTKRTIRSRYALRFGDEKSDYTGETQRADDVRLAFNSPFRPFVLATTSVGQEGLDFHQYCHRVVHWNLPPNPVDFEQREGRVQRYKGHVIRRNLSKIYKLENLQFTRNGEDPWQLMFEKAISERKNGVSDLVPFWVFEVKDGYAIERLIPILPLSREVEFVERLKKSLVLYRSVMGQPRQQEFIEFLVAKMDIEKADELLKQVVIDLSPD